MAPQSDRDTIWRLYYTEGWTAKRIQDVVFPGLKVKTIQKIAANEAVARQEKGPATAIDGASTTLSEGPEIATQVILPPAEGGPQPREKEA